MERPSLENGKCKGHGELFFTTLPFDKTEKLKVAAAKTLCNACEHKQECLEYAILHEEYGIWGGLTERQRHAARRALKIRLSRPESEIVELGRSEHKSVTTIRKQLLA